MPIFGLQIKAQIENVTGLISTGEDFRWYMRLKCCSCGVETETHQYLTQEESQPLKGGRGEASLVIKCKMCSRENSIDILVDSIRSYDEDDSNRFKTIAKFDCRGVEPLDFTPKIGWTVRCTESNNTFDDVDLTELEWTDYDEGSSSAVSIMEVESKFIKEKH